MTWHYYDLVAGVELRASNLTLHVEKDGYGGLLATPNTTADDPELAALLSKMAAFNAKPIASFDPTWHFELGGMVKQPPAPQQGSAAPQLKMAKIPGGKYRFVVQGVEIEGGGSNYNDIGKGVDVQHSWEPRPNRFHSQCDSFLSAAVVSNTNGDYRCKGPEGSAVCSQVRLGDAIPHRSRAGHAGGVRGVPGEGGAKGAAYGPLPLPEELGLERRDAQARRGQWLSARKHHDRSLVTSWLRCCRRHSQRGV